MLHAVILAGGSGTRFWPLSRRGRPKQLLPLAGTESLLRQSFGRLEGLVELERVHVVTSALLADSVREELPELPAGNLFAEPEQRDTALAAALAAAVIVARDPAAVLAVLPADHVIRPKERFQAALREAAQLAVDGWIVTFGIPSSSPHTGYGYIRRGESLDHAGALQAHAVEAFEEKPDRATAEGYVLGGRHCWNSGIFVWKAETLLEGLRRHRPKVAAAAERIAARWDAPEREQVLREEYGRAEKISIDYALLERAERVAVLAADFAWSDVGSWSALPELNGVDGNGNTIRGARCVAIDSSGCVVQGDGRLLALLGVEDVIVVQTADATLIARKDRAQDLKDLVERLASEGLEDIL